MRCSPNGSSPPSRGLLGLALLLSLSACGADGGSEGAARHLIVLSLDTVRADRLGCYGHAAADTPTLDGLAAEGVRFTAATAAAPTTLASHAALFTGTPPQVHGVPRNGFVLAPGNVTLAEALQGAGFRTLAAVGAFPLASAFGLGQGFERYDDALGSAPGDAGYAERDAAAVTDAALRLVDDTLAEDADARLFLFAHYFDAHAPHVPPPPFDASWPADAGPIPATLADGVVRAADEQYERLLGRRPGRSLTIQGLPRDLVDAADGEPRGIDTALDGLYLGELAYLDRELGRLLHTLEQRGVLDDAAILVTSDHGETMWEHADFWNHGQALHETTLNVPLLVRAPRASGRTTAGTVATQPVSGIDLAPTALGLVGVDTPSSMRGVDLAAALVGAPLERGPVFAEATMPFGVERSGAWPNALKPHAVREGDWKYVRWPYNGHEQLFDLSQDPGERNNLLAQVDAGRRAQADELAAQLDAWLETARPFPAEYRAGRDASMLRALDALGYGGGEGDGR